MSDYLTKSGLQVHHLLVDFVEKEALPGGKVSADQFWSGFAALVADHGPTNVRLLNKRDQICSPRSTIGIANMVRSPTIRRATSFSSRTSAICCPSPKISPSRPPVLIPRSRRCAVPQLVVPVSNARYALNAANARWGSLYDAFYGTDVISREGDLAPGKGYNVARGAAVVAKAAAVPR